MSARARHAPDPGPTLIRISPARIHTQVTQSVRYRPLRSLLLLVLLVIVSLFVLLTLSQVNSALADNRRRASKLAAIIVRNSILVTYSARHSNLSSTHHEPHPPALSPPHLHPHPSATSTRRRSPSLPSPPQTARPQDERHRPNPAHDPARPHHSPRPPSLELVGRREKPSERVTRHFLRKLGCAPEDAGCESDQRQPRRTALRGLAPALADGGAAGTTVQGVPAANATPPAERQDDYGDRREPEALPTELTEEQLRALPPCPDIPPDLSKSRLPPSPLLLPKAIRLALAVRLFSGWRWSFYG
ncbi:hypothetical protein C7M84_024780 [Penaeus vannamei]|uniref:Uncharacterized protein n=1 Tax=Penaeus vannamei TaxID=6689 RepID=A0A423U023_PENVA|nr:hypothetical protein C7M84_024780 [Penaeus vannamei]